ncbi:MAG TPA: hypothetical protein VFF67_04570 [Thermoplasmata archaeon]|nr:hypothetical protein [Thermoplasmata archaeon]
MHRAVPVAMMLAVVAALLATTVTPNSLAGFVASSRPASGPSAHLRTAATDAIATTDQYGAFTTDFFVGYNGGSVYWRAYDPTDTTATVAINDGNATRDGLANPVFTRTVNFNTGTTNSSYLWNLFYKIPFFVHFGGYWNVTLTGATAGTVSQKFFVHTYVIGAELTASAYLPGHSGSVYFEVDSTVTGGPFSSVSNVYVIANYAKAAGGIGAVSGFPRNVSTGVQGTFNFTVPTDALTYTGGVNFLIFANISSPAESESTSLTAPVADVNTPAIQVRSCPSGCATGVFQDGTPVYVIVQATLSWGNPYFGTAPAAGLSVSFHFTSASNPVTPPGAWPANLTTNSSGGAAIVFIASATTFVTTAPAAVTVSLTDAIDPAVHVTSTTTFSVTKTAPGVARLQVLLDSAQYYGGDTVKASWQLGGVNSSGASAWVVSSFFVFGLNTGTVVAWGNLTGSAAQGSVSFTLPVGFGGTIEVVIEAHNGTSSTAGFSSASVTAPTILLNPNEAAYLPGDTVTVAVTTEGQVFNGATIYTSVVDSSGNTLFAGTLTNGAISVTIPKVGAPSSVTFNVAAETMSNGLIARQAIVLDEASGYTLWAGVTTASNYVDNSFQPGQTVTIHYQIAGVGATPLPRSFEIVVYPGASLFTFSGYGSVLGMSTSPTGSVQYTLPSNTPAGAQSFTVYAYIGACGFSCFAASAFSLNVNPSPSALGYELGAGSGLTVGWLILFLLIVIIAIVGLIWHRGHGRPVVMKPEGGSGSQAWKETGGSGGGSSSSSSQPPLPPPSGGS